MVASDPFRQAFVRLRREHGLYRESPNGVTFLTPILFHTGIALSAEVPTGTYEVNIKLFADGALVGDTQTAFEIVKVGFEQFVATSPHHHGLATERAIRPQTITRKSIRAGRTSMPLTSISMTGDGAAGSHPRCGRNAGARAVLAALMLSLAADLRAF